CAANWHGSDPRQPPTISSGTPQPSKWTFWIKALNHLRIDERRERLISEVFDFLAQRADLADLAEHDELVAGAQRARGRRVDLVLGAAAKELLAHAQLLLRADDADLGVQALRRERDEGVVLVGGEHGEDACRPLDARLLEHLVLGGVADEREVAPLAQTLRH